MRISTQVFYNRTNENMMNQQAKLSQQNVHLSTGKRVIHGADDAVAISTIKRIKQDISSGEQYIENGKVINRIHIIHRLCLSYPLIHKKKILVKNKKEENHNNIAKSLHRKLYT